jgi:holo-[acyl-carrier protein] synthase
MNFVGHGIDIVEIERIKNLLEKLGSSYEIRCFTEMELITAKSNANRIQFLAGRFAAKEAITKALGTGWSQEISLTDIEIQRLSTGQPTVILHGKCQEIASELGILKWLLSISHTDLIAVASAIALG